MLEVASGIDADGGDLEIIDGTGDERVASVEDVIKLAVGRIEDVIIICI